MILEFLINDRETAVNAKMLAPYARSTYIILGCIQTTGAEIARKAVPNATPL
jgi:hypothetical protein